MSNPENIETDAKGVRRCTIEIDGENVKHVELECAEGHMWWRKSQRGVRPALCPEHSEAPAEKTDKPETSRWQATEDELALYEHLSEGDHEKVVYIDGELRKPIWREGDDKIELSTTRRQDDHNALRKHRDEILRSASRNKRSLKILTQAEIDEQMAA